MPMFRKRPVVIEARQFAGSTGDVLGVYQWIESHTAGSFEPLAVLDGDVPAPESGVSIDPGTGDHITDRIDVGEMDIDRIDIDWTEDDFRALCLVCPEADLTGRVVPREVRDRMPGPHDVPLPIEEA